MASAMMSSTVGSSMSMSMSTTVDPTTMLNNQLASALSTLGDAQFWEETISPSTIRTELAASDPSNPNSTPILLKGMKWLLASISKGRDVSEFYPHVVKLVGATSLEVRKMVYMYLVQYADYDATTRELSLLSINSFQRGLADQEQLIRALALRVLSSIRIPDILQIQILGVQKCANDQSPYVRKCAANAFSKLAPRCDAAQKEMLLDMNQDLLDSDSCTMVLSSALIAVTELCPTKLEVLHSSFRKICHLLTDMDEWGQVVIVDLLARYCRKFFKEPRGWKEGSAAQIDRERRVRRTVTGIYYEQQQHVGTALDALTLSTSTTAATQQQQQQQQGATSKGFSDHPNTHHIGFSDNPNSKSNSNPIPHGGFSESAPKKIKRRVIQKGFYSDEEDNSAEEEVYVETHSGNVLGSTAARQRNSLGVPGVQQPMFALNSTTTTNTTTNTTTMMEAEEQDMDLDEDHKLLLHSVLPLLKSRNSGVVLGVCSLLYYCGVSSVKTRSAIGKALVRIHRGRREIQYVVLTSIRTMVNECPSAFAPFLQDFFVKVR
jgi:hypothetical protein